jgi:cytochrome b561
MATSTSRYTNIAISLHWLIAGLMIYMLFFGEDLIARAHGTAGPSLHATIGVSILILSLARLGWRLANPPPALPATIKSWEARASELSHGLFYVLMIGLPLTGLMAFTSHMMAHPDAKESQIFWSLPVPALPDFGFGGPAHLLHTIGSKVGIALLILHVAAALKHQFWDKDNVLRRMSPH